ncbi:MAG: twin-arginine translocase subunit TatC [Ectothiorhodospiraceae bacterium]|nr:twin-arginine translocase subunit TatC [Ectothiorhodospiraceae bacterium]
MQDQEQDSDPAVETPKKRWRFFRRKKKKPAAELTFLDHLEELRWRIIYSFIGIVVGAIVVWTFKDFVVDGFLIKPAVENDLKLINLRPFGQVILYMQVAFFGGIIISMPNIILQVWKFVSPGLYPHERKYIGAIVVFTSLCFLTGVAFAYYAIMPAALSFFVSFGSAQIENHISIEEYFNFILNLMLGAGLVFELPMVSFFLSKLGILKPEFMRKYWRHAVTLIFILAAFLTPGTDPVSMVILAVPLMGLYEISVWICKWSQKKKPDELEDEPDQENVDEPEQEDEEQD